MKLRPMKFVWLVVALAIATVAVLSVYPSLLPQTNRLVLQAPYVQIIAIRGMQAIVLVLAALFLFIVSVVRRTVLDRGRIALGLAVVLVACAGFHGGLMFSRGLTNHETLSPDSGITQAGAGDGSITVMQYNTEGGKVSREELADLVEANGVDVITLVETSQSMGAELVQELAARGLTFVQFDNDQSRYAADWGSSVILVSTGLGDYAPIDVPPSLAQTGVPVVALAPASGQGPKIVVVHPVAPAGWGALTGLSNERLATWRAQVTASYDLCTQMPDAIIAGDFNSTADHEQALGARGCRDAMNQAGSGGLGTWPSNLPTLLSSPIDRIMSPSGYRGDQALVTEAGQSDHRGIIVRLKPRSRAS
ncbi:MAG: endonuclease/exonuclease/phosphatase family protein [Actinomycetaceae bacterium]|nr:endonuclease/exonuclease/phosphatase family protein [Actinomycetaceae bacterium]